MILQSGCCLKNSAKQPRPSLEKLETNEIHILFASNALCAKLLPSLRL